MKLIEFSVSNVVVIYSGRFQPFHPGHKKVYDWLTAKFDTVWVATSGKVSLPKSPWSFEEKKAMIMLSGVSEDNIAQVQSPYSAMEITQRYNPKNTAVVYAVSEKDMGEDARFKFQEGEAGYFQPFDINKLQSVEKHSYLITVPTFDFELQGQTMNSATQVRDLLISSADSEVVEELFGDYDSDVHDSIEKKISALTAIA